MIMKPVVASAENYGSVVKGFELFIER